MSYSAQMITLERTDGSAQVAELTAGKYTAQIAPWLGSNIIKMIDSELGIDFFRHDDSFTIAEMKSEPVIYGFPTLYLHNRLHGGILKTSDATYHFPLNEAKFGNSIHGFLHEREHTVVALTSGENYAEVKTEYVYDEKDAFFEYFPVSFKAEYTFRLDDAGMHYTFKMTNLSKDKMLPFGMCNHTAMNGPFVIGAKPEDTRIYIPIGDKWLVDDNRIPTLEIESLNDYDKKYQDGTMVPVLQDIDNDLYDMTVGQVDGKPYRGAVLSDAASNKQIRYEVSDNYLFWIVWNHEGDKGYFCPEPMTWMIDAPNLPLSPERTGYKELAFGESDFVTSDIYSVQG